METFFKELFNYNFQHNQKLATLFLDNRERASEKSVKIFNHLLIAQHIWNSRIQQQPGKFGLGYIHPPEELKSLDERSHHQSLSILDTIPLNTEVAYSTSKGQEFTNTVRDILFHIINHSSYHRGQIAMDFREHGLDPLVSDYIFFKR